MAKQIRSLPPLPCQSCGANILQMGFHNTCTQLIAVREDNYLEIVDGCIYFDHDQKNHAQVSHDCGTYAYCSNCNRPLPWPLSRLRELGGVALTRIDNDYYTHRGNPRQTSRRLKNTLQPAAGQRASGSFQKRQFDPFTAIAKKECTMPRLTKLAPRPAAGELK